MYAVVEFLNGENESTGQISIVPLIWIHKNDKKCYWPIRTNKVSFEDFVKKLTPFKKSWPAYKIKIHSRTASYSVAEKTLKNLLSNYPESSDSTRSFTQKNVEFSDNESSDSDGNELPKNVHQKETVTVRNEINCTDTLENETITGDTGSPGSISNETLSFQRHTEFETTVLNLLSQMAVNINQHSILLNEINRHTSAINADKLVEPKNLPKFPITSVEEFKKFEEEILNDSSLREYMVKRWAALGGTCPENLTRRILKQLITNEGSTSYNWKGRDKNSFEKMTTIMETIYAAVKHTFAAGEINELKIANSVKDWLKYAKLRMGKQKVLNPLDAICNKPRRDAVCVSQLRSGRKVDEAIIQERPDVKIFLPFRFLFYKPEQLFKPHTYNRFLAATGGDHVISLIDEISFAFPTSPPLSQLDDIDQDIFCHGDNRPPDCGQNCMCTHMVDIPYNAIVEVVLVDEVQSPNLSHPFHLHGYSFNVVGIGRSPDQNVKKINLKHALDLDRRGLLHRQFNLPPYKDTIAVPNNGYVIFRFRADNPGYWLFHCHFLFHIVIGMDLIVHVGTQRDLPPVPPGFPKCGNHLPPITPPSSESHH